MGGASEGMGIKAEAAMWAEAWEVFVEFQGCQLFGIVET